MGIPVAAYRVPTPWRDNRWVNVPATAPVEIRIATDCPRAAAWLADFLVGFRATGDAPPPYDIYLTSSGGKWVVATTDEEIVVAEPIDRFLLLDRIVCERLAAAWTVVPALHASAVLDRHGEAWLFCGHSGSGKSTLAYALVGQGCPWLTDEVVALAADRQGGKLRALPFPRPFSISDVGVVDRESRARIAASASYSVLAVDRSVSRVSVFLPAHSTDQDARVAGLIELTDPGQSQEVRLLGADATRDILLTHALSSMEEAAERIHPSVVARLSGGTVAQRIEALRAMGMDVS